MIHRLIGLWPDYRNKLKWKFFHLRLALEDRRNRAFDEHYRVETAREEALGELGLSPSDAERGNGVYRVTWGWLIEKALARLDIDFRHYTFVDYGSGKGKAMLIAACRPFKAIIGIEYARHLHDIAAANCQTYRNLDQKCHSLLPIFGDVLNYPLPPGPIICFMCNPFDQNTLRAVFNNWRERYRAGERELRILYLNMRDIAESAEVLEEQDWLIPVARDRRFVVLAPAVPYNANDAR